MRIVHITDFHLNKVTKDDWSTYVKGALLNTLRQIHEEKAIDLVAFTGDALDQGGKGFANAAEAFNEFEELFISPILAGLDLNKNQFAVVPGNHDIQRNQDDRRDELGNRAYFEESQENIRDFMLNAESKKDFDGFKRIESYKNFETGFYGDIHSGLVFGNSMRINELYGVSCFDSAWRSYDEADAGQLILGEIQLKNNLEKIKDCKYKIALLHHPIEDLTKFDQDNVISKVYSEFDLLLIGHKHEAYTSMNSGFTGTLFINMSPSELNDIRTDSVKYSNGFTLIDFEPDQREIICKYMVYNHPNESFVVNTRIADNGQLLLQIPTKKDKQDVTIIKSALKSIEENYFDDMDGHMIGAKANKENSSIRDEFVMPPVKLNAIDDEEQSKLGISDIVRSKHFQIFFGSQESGKTTLLYRLCHEFVSEYDHLRKVPVYIDLLEVGNQEISTVINRYLKCSPRDAIKLIEGDNLVLLVDNLDHENEAIKHVINRLQKFSDKYEGVQIIATAYCSMSGILPADFGIKNSLPFRVYFIERLRSKEIKYLMRMWSPHDDDLLTDQRLDKLVSNFMSFSLPSTAMSVSLFLWSQENSDRKPINHAVLLEIYIELLLQKLNPLNVYRERFDFTNKVQMLASIAHEMLIVDEPNYSIKYSEFLTCVEGYLEKVAFDFDAQVIADHFLEKKLFVKTPDKRIKFTYRCFFHFFLAKRMTYNTDFRAYVLDESRYFRFVDEIDYYTGLVRSDEALLNDMLTRFDRSFNELNGILENVELDALFNKLHSEKNQENTEHSAINVDELRSNRPSEKMLEQIQDQRLQQIKNPDTIIKKSGQISMDRLMMLMSNVLRNSEGVENKKLKAEAYDSLIRNSLIYTLLLRESLIDYIIDNQRLPPHFPSHISPNELLFALPLIVQMAMFKHTGSPKLASIISDKIDLDRKKKRSDIEKMYSIFLYSDIKARDFDKRMHSFIKTVGENPVREYLFRKLVHYYYTRTRDGSSNEKKYIDLILQLRRRSLKLSQRMKEDIISRLEKGKEAYNSLGLKPKS